MPGRKAPGIDRMAYQMMEILKHLPRDFHDAIHMLFTWELRVTPREWKIALTILLYKKMQPT